MNVSELMLTYRTAVRKFRLKSVCILEWTLEIDSETNLTLILIIALKHLY